MKTLIISLLLLVIGCQEKVLERSERFYQGYRAGIDYCDSRRKSAKFELWEGSGIFNRYTHIDDAKKALSDCLKGSMPMEQLTLKTHLDIERHLFMCIQYEALKEAE